MKIYINLTKLSSHTITPYLYNFTFTVAHFSSLTPPPLHLEKWCLSDHPRRNRYTRSVSHSRTTFCDFCYVSSFGQLKTGFGPPSQWSRFCWSELSKQNARNVGSRVTDGPCIFPHEVRAVVDHKSLRLSTSGYYQGPIELPRKFQSYTRCL